MIDKTTSVVRVKDATLGILVLILSAFLYYAVWAMTGYISIWELIVLLTCGWWARFLLRLGVNFIKGVNIDIS